MDRLALETACRTLPLFPLPGVTLLPGNLLPLHVFEPRYRQLVRDCLGSGGPLSVPEVRPEAAATDDRAPPFLPYAGVGVIAAHEARPDGRFDIVLEPVGRVRIVEELAETGHPYRVGRAELLVDEPVPAAALAKAGDRVRGLMAAVLARSGAAAPGLRRALETMPAERVPDAMAGVVLQDLDARQGFLKEDNPLIRAALVERAVLTLLAEAAPGSGAEA